MGQHPRRTALPATRPQGTRASGGFVMWDWPEHKISHLHSTPITTCGVTPF
jgi:hypothetical protein